MLAPDARTQLPAFLVKDFLAAARRTEQKSRPRRGHAEGGARTENAFVKARLMSHGQRVGPWRPSGDHERQSKGKQGAGWGDEGCLSLDARITVDDVVQPGINEYHISRSNRNAGHLAEQGRADDLVEGPLLPNK